MYKIICALTYAEIWRTRDEAQAISIAKKYEAFIFRKNVKIFDFS